MAALCMHDLCDCAFNNGNTKLNYALQIGQWFVFVITRKQTLEP
jgi:hypothetical protein